jgi:hypothetical protein
MCIVAIPAGCMVLEVGRSSGHCPVAKIQEPHIGSAPTWALGAHRPLETTSHFPNDLGLVTEWAQNFLKVAVLR